MSKERLIKRYVLNYEIFEFIVILQSLKKFGSSETLVILPTIKNLVLIYLAINKVLCKIDKIFKKSENIVNVKKFKKLFLKNISYF